MIADLRRAGVSLRGIAEQLGRAASTISRELRRNADDEGHYLPATAQRLAVGIEPALLHTTGQPWLMASSGGIPKPSYIYV
jgi:lambda repressor-like predicted transcriptional regulator